MENQQQENKVETNEQDNQHYIDAINELKANSVSREKYDKVVQENKNLVQTLVAGNYGSAEQQTPEVKKSVEECRKELFNPEKDLNNLEYAKRVITLRNRLLEETGEDCFLGLGEHKQEDYIVAEKVAKTFEECIEYADGDNALFTQELQRRMVETAPPLTRR